MPTKLRSFQGRLHCCRSPSNSLANAYRQPMSASRSRYVFVLSREPRGGRNDRSVGPSRNTGIEPLRIASQVMQNSTREHGARATRGRGLVDRTTFPYEDLRDGATLPTGPGTLLAHGRPYEQTNKPSPTRIRNSCAGACREACSNEAVEWNHVSRAGNPCSRARINRHFPALGREF